MCSSDLLLAWDERFALLMVVITAFGRAVSEVGAVMVVGGNIEGFTRVMTTAIALETSKGDLPLALALGCVLLGVVLLLNAGLAGLQRWRQRVEGVTVASWGERSDERPKPGSPLVSGGAREHRGPGSALV